MGVIDEPRVAPPERRRHPSCPLGQTVRTPRLLCVRSRAPQARRSSRPAAKPAPMPASLQLKLVPLEPPVTDGAEVTPLPRSWIACATDGAAPPLTYADGS